MVTVAATLALVANLAVLGLASPSQTKSWGACTKPNQNPTLELREPTKVKPQDETPTPQPTQPGIDPNCNNFCFVQPGDACYQIAQDQGISLDDFLKWNLGAGQECHTLWAGTYACIGVSQ